MLSKALFVDKDGTIIEDLPYNVDPAKIRFMPGVPEGLRLVHAAGYRIIVVTNQSGIARGYFTEEELAAASRRIAGMMAEAGVPLAGFYFCPHLPGGVIPGYDIACSCRKPQPGLIVRAAREHAIDVTRSWIAGDILNDVEAGHRAGCRAVMIDTGKETEWVLSRERLPDHIVPDFLAAARVIAALTDAWPQKPQVRLASAGTGAAT
jgi:histidinol-phosphate phosphatase family protein